MGTFVYFSFTSSSLPRFSCLDVIKHEEPLLMLNKSILPHGCWSDGDGKQLVVTRTWPVEPLPRRTPLMLIKKVFLHGCWSNGHGGHLLVKVLLILIESNPFDVDHGCETCLLTKLQFTFEWSWAKLLQSYCILSLEIDRVRGCGFECTHCYIG